MAAKVIQCIATFPRAFLSPAQRLRRGLAAQQHGIFVSSSGKDVEAGVKVDLENRRIDASTFKNKTGLNPAKVGNSLMAGAMISPSSDILKQTTIIDAESGPICPAVQATTPIVPCVLDASLSRHAGLNRTSHTCRDSDCWKTTKAIDVARQQVAKLKGGHPKEIVFTPGATELSNFLIKHLQEEEYDRKHLPIKSNSLIKREHLEKVICPDTALVSSMMVNKEIGVIQPMEEIGKLYQKSGALFYTNDMQAVGKPPVDVGKWGADLTSNSRPKAYTPKQKRAGYIHCGPKFRIDPLMSDRGQEHSGTHAHSPVISFGEPCRISQEESECTCTSEPCFSHRSIYSSASQGSNYMLKVYHNEQRKQFSRTLQTTADIKADANSQKRIRKAFPRDSGNGIQKVNLPDVLLEPGNPPLSTLHTQRLAANTRWLSTTCLRQETEQRSSLRIRSHTIEAFPRCSVSNFYKLRANPRFGYFDRTRYISVLDSMDACAILFLWPRRFGKSLTLSMLEHFHGIQYRDQYDKLFKGLDVEEDVKRNKVTPGEYMILKFNFAEVRRAQDLNEAAKGLAGNIIKSLEEFYGDYYSRLGMSFDQLKLENIDSKNAIISLTSLVKFVHRALREIKHKGDAKHPLYNVKEIYLMADEYDTFTNEYMDPHNTQLWSGSDASLLVKDFWATVKGMTNLLYGIQRCFITGISPLSLADNTSGFNIAVNISFKKEVAGLCSLSRAEIVAALEKLCESKVEVEKHLEKLTRYANGYHFCHYQKSEPAIQTGDDFDIANPPNSEVSQRVLDIAASSPGAVAYGRALGDLEETAFCTLLLYFGAFTFDKENPSQFLTIPTYIVAKRFSSCILRRFSLLGSMRNAIRFLALHGNLIAPLKSYQQLMVACDTSDPKRPVRLALAVAGVAQAFLLMAWPDCGKAAFQN
ncbi:hypothetical protein HOY82DRAFT_672718 [Tuber indicum]|nr:hypothetical protein HOY82DRAFT_672718 [Tuber indicum]